jgi:hypothetical protein
VNYDWLDLANEAEAGIHKSNIASSDTAIAWAANLDFELLPSSPADTLIKGDSKLSVECTHVFKPEFSLNVQTEIV